MVQKHWALKAGLHFDFRFEENGVAPSWAVPKGFSQDKVRIAIQVPDHAIPYMDWEGEIPEGYGAGTVEIWEKGILTIVERTPDLVKFSINEGKLKGSWCLTREDGTKWFLTGQLDLKGKEVVPTVLNRTEIVSKLNEIAERLQASGEDNEFRVRAYKSAAGTVQRLKDFERLDEEQLQQLPGMGPALSKTISDLRATGSCKQLSELPEVKVKKRYPHAEAMEIAQKIVGAIKQQFPQALVEIAGSLRRGKDPKDIDILIAGDDGDSNYAKFCRTLGASLNLGEKALAVAREGIQIDLRIVPKKCYGAGLLFFTGSADFNIRCRAKAKRLGMKLTRYGLEDLRDGRMIAQTTEREILDALGIEWLEPKERNA